MKTLSFIRRVDHLGRLVIPSEIRRAMELDYNREIEMTVRGDELVLRRYTPGCIFCGGSNGLKAYEGKYICVACREKIREEI